MASVFLSYDRDDAKRARPLALALEKAGHSVWWDLHVRGGAQFSKVIEEALAAANAVVVLWSAQSVESPWVRDEAAVGRDTGRLVPVSLDGTEAPLGFRQFQTRDLSKWHGRGKPAALRALFTDIETMGATCGDKPPQAPPAREQVSSARPQHRRWLIIAATALALVILGAFLTRSLRDGRPAMPAVTVEATDRSPLSQTLVSDVSATLASPETNPQANFRLLDTQAKQVANLRVTIAAVQGNPTVGANVSVVSMPDQSVLWAKQFHQANAATDLNRSIAFAVGRVLRCAVDEASAKSGELSQQARALYLKACAAAAELGWDPRRVLPSLREVVGERPKFAPAWRYLLAAETDSLSLLMLAQEPTAALRSQIRSDIDAARRVEPDMGEAALAEAALLPQVPFAKPIALLDQAKTAHPNNPAVLTAHSAEMLRVGRMQEALDDADRAAALDPLSPATRSAYILALAYSGMIDRAREELTKAKQLWPDATTIQQAEYSIELRFGDTARVMLAHAPSSSNEGFRTFVAALRDPSDGNIAAVLKLAGNPRLSRGPKMAVLQALPRWNRVDEAYDLLDRWSVEKDLTEDTYIFFRPWMNNLRRDPRFVKLAKRLGLVDYWKQSGNWPDFCSEPGFPYNCRAEAEKLPLG